MSKKKILISLLLCGILILGMDTSYLFATSVQPNQIFTVQANCSVFEGSVSVRASNATITNDGSGGWCDRNKSFSISAQAGSSGIATISVVGQDLIDTSVVPPVEVAGSRTIFSSSIEIVQPTPVTPPPAPVTPTPPTPVNPNPPSNQSPQQPTTPPQNNSPQEQNNPKENEVKEEKDYRLKEITVNVGELSPSFSPDHYDYTLYVDPSTTSVEVKAMAIDESFKVAGIGVVELTDVSEKEIELYVESDSEEIQKYKIKVIKDKKIDFTYQGNTLTYEKNHDLDVPQSFEEFDLSYNNETLKAYRNPLTQIVILPLKDQTSTLNFYMYDEVSKMITSIYKPIALLGRNLVIIDIPKELQAKEGFQFKEIQVDDITLMGWSFENAAFSNYRLLYLMDEDGIAKYYLYEINEHTLQSYSKQAPITEDEWKTWKMQNEKQYSQMRMYFMISVGSNLILLLIIIIIAVRMRKKSKGNGTSSRFIKDNSIEIPTPNEPLENDFENNAYHAYGTVDDLENTMDLSMSQFHFNRNYKNDEQ